MTNADRAFAHARRAVLPHNFAPAFNITNLGAWPALALKPKKSLGSLLYDCSFVVAAWIMLVGMFEYPSAHLIGLVVCGLALLVTVENSPSNGTQARSRI
jgi:hypothetical protein